MQCRQCMQPEPIIISTYDATRRRMLLRDQQHSATANHLANVQGDASWQCTHTCYIPTTIQP